MPLHELPEVIHERGPLAYLVTVGDRGPRVVSVTVEVLDGGLLAMAAGRHTVANVAARPAVTLLWPADADHPVHTLLVDGGAAGAADGDGVVVTPASAILHRIRRGHGADPEG